MRTKKNLLKKDLIRKAAKASKFSQEKVSIVYDALFDGIIEILKEGNTLHLDGFGKFTVSDYKEVKNLNNDYEHALGSIIPAHKEPKFRFFKSVKAEF